MKKLIYILAFILSFSVLADMPPEQNDNYFPNIGGCNGNCYDRERERDREREKREKEERRKKERLPNDTGRRFGCGLADSDDDLLY